MPQNSNDLSRHSAEEPSTTAAGAAFRAPDPMVAAVEMVKAAEAELDATIAEWSNVEKVLADEQRAYLVRREGVAAINGDAGRAREVAGNFAGLRGTGHDL